MSEPTLVDRRTGRSFRQFQARPPWVGDEEYELIERQREAISKFCKLEDKGLWRWLKDRWLWLRYFSWQ